MSCSKYQTVRRQAFGLLGCVLLLGGKMLAQDVDLQSLVYQKQYEAVVGHAARLQKADSADYRTMYAVAQAYEGLLRYRDAYNCYRHCLTLGDVAPVDLLNAVARMAANIGMANEAESYFRRALAVDSVDFYANYQLARLYFQSGNYVEASALYTFLSDRHPDNFVLLRGLGDCFSRMDLLPEAAMFYLQAFNLNRENTGLASVLVNTLLTLDQAAAAIPVCDTALVYNPGSTLILQNKGLALFTAREYERADSIYSFLMEQGDSTYLTLKFGGFAKYYAGKFLEAIVPLEKAYERDTTALDVCMYLGSALGRTYDRPRAYGLFDRADALMQPNPSLTDLLMQFKGETYGRDRRTEEAVAIFYTLWKKNKRADMLSRIWTNSSGDILKREDESRRRRSLFVHVLMATEYENNEQNGQILSYIRNQLQKFGDDMFFRGLTEYPMLAPDGGKSVLTVDRLREIIRQLPEKPENEQEHK
ncbi:MAG: tetratricopeptide repeat protein [Tannerella sp.]|jgi:tetratricopeptide (TPR) repeat protein|nr:tetratricopeptide repeat protein [Tannerella sp.]